MTWTSQSGAGGNMRRLHAATMATPITASLSLTTGGAGASPPGSAWHSAVSFTNVVASSLTMGGGYPVPLGSRVPEAGRAARVRSMRTTPSRGLRSSRVPRISSGRRNSSSTSTRPSTCSTTARTRSWAGRRRPTTRSRAMTASRQAPRPCRRAGQTRQTPIRTFDTQGRVYQTMLPYNSFFDATKLHPDGEIDRGKHLRAHGLDPLPLDRHRGRRRPDLLPATGAGHGAARWCRRRLLNRTALAAA